MTRIALAVCALAAAALFPQSAAATFPGQNGRIAFVQRGDVWTVGPDGGGAAALTRGLRAEGSRTEELDPSVSPDGRLVAYLAESRDCTARICLNDVFTSRMDGRGSPRSVTRALSRRVKVPRGGRARGERRYVSFGAAAWSPDGRNLVLQCRVFRFGDEGHHFTELCVVDAAGRKIRRLTKCDCAPPGPGTRPDWSPAGDRIAWGDGRNLWTVTPGGRSLRRVVDPGAVGERFLEQVSWSPDGASLAFAGARARGRGASLYVARADGGAVERVLEGGADASYTRPAWSPDGRELALHADFAAAPDGIHRVARSGGAPALVRALSAGPLYLSPAWGRAP